MDQDPVAMEADVASISSTASPNEEARASPSPEIIDLPEHECHVGKFPARKVVDGETSARTNLPFISTRKPPAIVEDNSTKQNVEKRTKEKKSEVSRVKWCFTMVNTYRKPIYKHNTKRNFL